MPIRRNVVPVLVFALACLLASTPVAWSRRLASMAAPQAPQQDPGRSTDPRRLPPEQFGTGVDGPLRVDEGTFTTDDVRTSVIGDPKGGTSQIDVASTLGFEVGDLVMLHQARGTSGEGSWAFNRLTAIERNTLHLSIPLNITLQENGQFGVAAGQVLKVPEYSSCTVGADGTVTAHEWNGKTGGFVVLLCGDALQVEGAIDATGLGYRGGPHYHFPNGECGYTGEGSRGVFERRASPSHGGNGGGGGGGNPVNQCNTAGPGGGGGAAVPGASSSTGIGGEAVFETRFDSILFGGGGGGPKTYSGSPITLGARGGNGGGMILVFARSVSGSGRIVADGGQASGFAEDDESHKPFSGGGGGGGGIFITAGAGDLTNVTLRALGAPMYVVPSGQLRDSGGAGGDGQVRLEYCELVLGEATPEIRRAKVYCGPRTPTPTATTPAPPTPTPSPTTPEPPTPIATATPIGRRACDAIMPLPADEGAAVELVSATDVATFRFEVLEPFTDVTLQVRDPDDDLDVQVISDCNVLGTGTGRHIGVGSRRAIVDWREYAFNVGSEIGAYFVTIGSKRRDGAFPRLVELRLSLSVDGTVRRTLILTDLREIERQHGIVPGSAEELAWMDAVNAFAAHDAVRGRVIEKLSDVTERGIQGAYEAWKQDRSDSTRANDLANAIRDWVWDQANAEGSRLRYLVILGDDRIVPFHRVNIKPLDGEDLQWSGEQAYYDQGHLLPNSSTGSALLDGLTLTDDLYGVPRDGIPGPLDRYGARVPVLPVGRLVETPQQMKVLLDGFVAGDGVIAADRSLVAGYDFMEDGADAADAAVAAAGLPDARRARLRGWWSAVDLLDALAAPLPDITGIAAHASHFEYAAPDGALVRAAEVMSRDPADAPFLVATLACHGGLSAPGVQPEALDFPEAWGALGGTLVGSTGWAYGMPDVLGYQEQLFASFFGRLMAGGGRSVGDALVDAKHDYYRTHSLNHYDAKTLAGTVLYGLPMARVHVAGGATAARDTGASVTAGAFATGGAGWTVTKARASAVGRADQAGMQVISKTLAIDTNELNRVDTANGSYFTFSDRLPFAEHGQPVEPMLTQELPDVYRDGQPLALHGAAFVGGRYELTPDPTYQPLIAHAGLLNDLWRNVARDPAPHAWLASPPVPHVARRAPDVLAAEGVGGTVAQPAAGMWYAGQVVDGRHRLYRTIDSTEYYSASSDWTPPELASVRTVTTDDSGGWFVLEAGVAEDDAERVLATCDDDGGAWHLHELRRVVGGIAASSRVAVGRSAVAQTGATWRSAAGAIAAGSRCIVQAVDDAGNVAVSHADGRYYRVPAPGGLVWVPVAER